MSFSDCEECQAILREFREAARSGRGRRFGQEMTFEQLIAYVQRLDQEEMSRMRATSPLWALWRKREEHRTRTGHAVPLFPMPPNAIGSLN